MTRIILLTLTILSCISVFAAPERRVSGRVLEDATGEPIHGAAIGLEGTYLWSMSNEKGEFTLDLSNLDSRSLTQSSGETFIIQISCLGYVTENIPLTLSGTGTITVRLKEISLALDEVVVTAQQRSDQGATTYVIDRTALDHLQMSSASNITALLPGGKTLNPDLTTQSAISLREGGDDAGNAAFGTAVEVDGVRMSNNASFGQMDGAGTRSIAVANIESVEVITGVPSVEYGDINSGIVRIHTRKGESPVNAQFSVNPRTYQASVSKGINLGGRKGVLNVSGEWARATSKLTSPYTSYSRRGISFTYSNTFKEKLRFEAGLKGNIGGMNTKDDPDAYTGSYQKDRDNVYQFNTSLNWMLNRPGVTTLQLDASVNFNDNRSHAHEYNTSSSMQPAVHATDEGYSLADQLPYTYYSDQIIDSKELDISVSAKYEWNWKRNDLLSKLKAGAQYKATGNAGDGEYYEDASLAPTGYRPRPYSDYPYMHNLALYVEENFSFPLGQTTLNLIAGLRMENLFIDGTQYRHKTSFSPRLNAKWKITDHFALRGGWGVTEKLPSYYILYPEQKYRDIQTFGVSYNNNQSQYVYYTIPYTLEYNPYLKWQRNQNSEFGFEAEFRGIKTSLVGFYNKTKNPYRYSNSYSPIFYNMLALPEDFTMPTDPQFKLDNQTGVLYVRGSDEEYWTAMDISTTYRSFVESTRPDNGADIKRAGLELVMDFPEIQPIKTSIRLDGSYNFSYYVDEGLTAYYQSGTTYSSDYVGIYALGGSTSIYNGLRTHTLDANLTTITHIPQARLVITCRLEMSLLNRSQRLSKYNGHEYAFNVSESGTTPTGGSIYEGNSYTAIWPVYYIDLDGDIHPFTDTEKADDAFAGLLRKSGNAYLFAADGYDPYFSANISITKEIGNHVSLSFFANNFTRSRRYVTSYATGVSAIFTPNFYYGLTCRVKF